MLMPADDGPVGTWDVASDSLDLTLRPAWMLTVHTTDLNRMEPTGDHVPSVVLNAALRLRQRIIAEGVPRGMSDTESWEEAVEVAADSVEAWLHGAIPVLRPITVTFPRRMSAVEELGRREELVPELERMGLRLDDKQAWITVVCGRIPEWQQVGLTAGEATVVGGGDARHAAALLDLAVRKLILPAHPQLPVEPFEFRSFIYRDLVRAFAALDDGTDEAAMGAVAVTALALLNTELQPLALEAVDAAIELAQSSPDADMVIWTRHLAEGLHRIGDPRALGLAESVGGQVGVMVASHSPGEVIALPSPLERATNQDPVAARAGHLIAATPEIGALLAWLSEQLGNP